MYLHSLSLSYGGTIWTYLPNKSFLILHFAPKFGLFKVCLVVNLDLDISVHKLDIPLNEGLYCFFYFN